MPVDVIIPAFNEEASIAQVIKAIPTEVREIIVVNNGSIDSTAEKASAAGATVLTEERKGYGYACLRGIAYLYEKKEQPDIVVFLDGDYSDYPEELSFLTAEIGKGSDLVIGSRTRGNSQKGALFIQQRLGNWLAITLIRFLYKVKYTDLGPFRAIRFKKLLELDMQDRTYGWTVEMQVKAAIKGYNISEVPVSYRKRIGQSKVSGTVKGTVMAGYKILATVFRYAL